jgi:hypothetical protein
MSLNINEEWTNFLSNKSDDDVDDNLDFENGYHVNEYTNHDDKQLKTNAKSEFQPGTAPNSTPIYISTKSKIAYLQDHVDLNIFWNIPVISYGTPRDGVIKKQIKFNSKTSEELNIIQQKLEKELYFDEHVITHIDNPNGRIKFKDIRKITIGISKKDIMSYRSKKKQAFYNCFVMIIRLKIHDIFREFHIKVFNTGKLEIPGVQSNEMYELVLENIIKILQPFSSSPLLYKQKSDTVLINSNFNCGFYINRESLFDILKYKYKIQAIYDPCSYPGIQCKFYYNNLIEPTKQTGIQLTSEPRSNDKKIKTIKNPNITEVSFMIFRTGSILIVGMCEESILNDIYYFLTNLLKTEFEHICQHLIDPDQISLKNKKKNVRRKIINIIITEEENVQVVQSKFEKADKISNVIFEEIISDSNKDTTVKSLKKSSYKKNNN